MSIFSYSVNDDVLGGCIPNDIADELDAILVLGGGVPVDASSPPSYVRTRCDAAAKIVMSVRDKRKSTDNCEQAPVIITLSAGTAHLPQLLSPDGLPIWESTASAAYIINNYPDIPNSILFAETTSYDTISNAFYTRTSFTDIMGWRRLLIITNEVSISFKHLLKYHYI